MLDVKAGPRTFEYHVGHRRRYWERSRLAELIYRKLDSSVAGGAQNSPDHIFICPCLARHRTGDRPARSCTIICAIRRCGAMLNEIEKNIRRSERRKVRTSGRITAAR